MAEYKGLSVVFEGDATSLSAALHTINAAAQQAQGNLSGLNRALKLDPTNTELLTRKSANLETSLKAARDRATQLSSATSDLAQKERSAAAAVRETGKGYNEAKANLARVDAQLKSNRQSLTALEEKLTDPKGNDAFLSGERSKYDALSKSTSALEEQRAVLGDVVSQHDRAKRSYEEASAALERNLTDIATSRSNYEQLSRQLDLNNGKLYAAESALGRFGIAAEAGGSRVAALGDSIVRTSGELAMFSAAALAFGTGSLITQTEEFGNAIAQVGGYLDVGGSKLSALSDLALEVGYSTQFSATEAAQAMSELAKGGMAEAEIAAGGLDATMALAAAGQMDLASAAETTVTSMRAFGLQAEDAMEIADALAGAANGSTAEVGDLATAFSQCSAVAFNAGWSIQETAGAIALLSDRGLQGQMAGTALKVMMQRLQSPTQAAAGVMEQYGIEVRDSNGQMKSATEITEELRTKLGTLGDAERDAALQTMFGTRASNAALILMQAGGDELDRYITLASDSGAASEMAQQQMGQLGWAMEYLRGEAETAVVSLGNALTPTLVDVAGAAEDLLHGFNELSPAAQSLVGKAAILVAALPIVSTAFGAILSVGGRVASVFGTMAKGISAFSGYMSAGSCAVSALGKALEFVGTKANGTTTGLAKAGSAIKRLSESFRQSAQYTALNSSALGSVGTALTKMGASAGTSAGAVNALSTAFTVVKGLGMAGMFAAVAGVVVQFAAGVGRAALKSMEMAEAQKRSKDAIAELDEASANLADTYDKVTDSTYSFTEAEEESKEVARDSASDIYDLAASIDQLSESMKDAQISYEAEVTQLNEAQKAIDAYANKSNLSVKEQNELQQAIDYVNQTCGTQYEVFDAANGKIREQGETAEVTAEELDALIQKQRELAQQAALQQMLTDAWKTYYEALDTATEKQNAYKEAVEKTAEKERELAEWKAQHQTGDKNNSRNGFDTWENWQHYKDLADELEGLETAESTAKGEMDEANGALDKQADLIDRLEGEMDDANAKADGALKTLQDWVDHTNQLNTDRWTDDLRKGFVSDFEAMGLSLEDFQNLSAGALTDISQNYDGTFKSLLDIMSNHVDEIGDTGARAMVEFYNGLDEASVSGLERVGGLTEPILQQLQASAQEFGISGDQAVRYYLEGMQSGALNSSSTGADIAAYIANSVKNDQAAESSGQSLGKDLYGGVDKGMRDETDKGMPGLSEYLNSQLMSGVSASADRYGPKTGRYMMQAVLGGMDPNGQFADKADEAANEYSWELGGNAVLTDGGVRLVDNASSGAAPNGKFGAQGLAGMLEYLVALANGSAEAAPYGTAMRDAAVAAAQPGGLFGAAGASAGTEYGAGIAGQEGSASSAGGTLASAAEAAMKTIMVFNLAGYASGLAFSSGLSGTKWFASQAGHALSTAAKGGMDTSWAWSSGNRLGSNFAAGIRSAYGAVASAASSLANAAAAYLHHSTPDKGPLRDDDVWGLHLARNIADGMRRGAGYVASASAELASSVVEPVASWGPVNPAAFQYPSARSVAGEVAAAVRDALSGNDKGSRPAGVYVENQNFNTKVVRADEDIYVAAPLIAREAARAVRGARL